MLIWTRKPIRLCATAALAILLSAGALAAGSGIRFQATVVDVSQDSETSAIVTVRLQTFEVPILVNEDTEIQLRGDGVGIEALDAGAFVKILGFFSPDGITAEEIDILDVGEGQFRLRGQITAAGPAIDGTLITLMGVDVLVDSDTHLIRRGPEPFLAASDLAAGLTADIVGIFDGDQLLAIRLRAGSRASDSIVVEFEGEVVTVTQGFVSVDVGGGDPALVEITDSTRISGEIGVGSFVEVRGELNESLTTVAYSIKVDLDGDGDADDDDGEADEDEDEDVDDDVEFGARRTRRTVQFVGASDLDLQGFAERDYLQTPGGPVIQEVEVSFHRAERNESFSVRVTFESGTVVDFGTVAANSGGRVKVKYRTHGGGNAPSLTGLLPAGETAEDVVGIEVLDSDGTVVLTADF